MHFNALAAVTTLLALTSAGLAQQPGYYRRFPNGNGTLHVMMFVKNPASVGCLNEKCQWTVDGDCVLVNGDHKGLVSYNNKTLSVDYDSSTRIGFDASDGWRWMGVPDGDEEAEGGEILSELRARSRGMPTRYAGSDWYTEGVAKPGKPVYIRAEEASPKDREAREVMLVFIPAIEV